MIYIKRKGTAGRTIIKIIDGFAVPLQNN